MNHKFRDLHGKTFSHWTVIRRNGKKNGHIAWECKCVCGNMRTIQRGHLVSGASTNCGCVAKANFRASVITHGASKTIEHATWCRIIDRCENKKLPCYKNYGGRGIKVCARWRHSFENFLEDMGYRPSNDHSIDRIDNEKGYSPSNCRWALRSEQMRNTRRKRVVTLNGKKMLLIEAAEIYGVNYGSVKWRLRQGQTVEQALKIA